MISRQTVFYNQLFKFTTSLLATLDIQPAILSTLVLYIYILYIYIYIIYIYIYTYIISYYNKGLYKFITTKYQLEFHNAN